MAEVRFAGQSDLASLCGLRRYQDETHRKAAEEEHRRRLAAAHSGAALYVIIEEVRELIGHVFLKLDGSATQPGHPVMDDLLVREGDRGRGLGTLLIAECERLTREHAFDKLGLAVNPFLNPRAKGLYERLGYCALGERPYLDGVYDGDEDWVIDMVKELLPEAMAGEQPPTIS